MAQRWTEDKKADAKEKRKILINFLIKKIGEEKKRAERAEKKLEVATASLEDIKNARKNGTEQTIDCVILRWEKEKGK